MERRQNYPRAGRQVVASGGDACQLAMARFRVMNGTQVDEGGDADAHEPPPKKKQQKQKKTKASKNGDQDTLNESKAAPSLYERLMKQQESAEVMRAYDAIRFIVGTDFLRAPLHEQLVSQAEVIEVAETTDSAKESELEEGEL